MAQEEIESVPIPLKTFLEDVPPGKAMGITDLCGPPQYPMNAPHFAYFSAPEILLHCPDPKCEGPRLFSAPQDIEFRPKQSRLLFVTYTCKNCGEETKIFALHIARESDRTGNAFKFGEFPAFGPPTPARLITLVGPDRELFLKGRRSENQGLGIAAFAYYRRVVERQKDRIFDEVIRVCKRLSAGDEIVAELTDAKVETQFTKAIDSLKHAIPQVLFINGQNPLTLLHGALSEGLHAESDEECLEWATVIRVVMAALAERMGQALKDEAEISTAVTKLLQKRSKPVLGSGAARGN